MSESNLNRFKWGLFGVSTLLGIMITIQFTSNADKPSLSGDLVQTRSELAYELHAQTEMRTEIGRLQTKIQEYQDSQGNQNEVMQKLASELNRVRQQAGLTVLNGEGIQVTIKDDPNLFISLPPSTRQSDLHISDTDLQLIINILFANGAQGISINGQRITTVTGIREVPPAMQVNTVPIQLPYVIKAVGDVDRMSSALTIYDLKNVYMSMAKDFLMELYKSPSLLQVPAYDQMLDFRFATEDTEGVTQK